jgi:hypothetical protein
MEKILLTEAPLDVAEIEENKEETVTTEEEKSGE